MFRPIFLFHRHEGSELFAGEAFDLIARTMRPFKAIQGNSIHSLLDM